MLLLYGPARVDLPDCMTVICHGPIRLRVARSITFAIFRS